MDGDGVNKKRATERQLTRENYKYEEGDGEEGPGEFERASEEQLKTRQRRRARRATPNVATTEGPNPFAGITLTAPTSTTPEQAPGAAAAEVTDDKDEAEQTPEAPPALETTEGDGDDVTLESGKESESTPVFGSGKSLFDTPSNMDTPVSTSAADSSCFKPLDTITSGEESEETVFCEKAGLYLNVKGAWKTVGRGEIKFNVTPEGGARLIMRQNITLKLLLNARVYPEIKPLPMGEDAVSFACQNNVQLLEKTEEEAEKTSELDILAVRFKEEGKKKAERLIEVIEQYKSGKKKDESA